MKIFAYMLFGVIGAPLFLVVVAYSLAFPFWFFVALAVIASPVIIGFLHAMAMAGHDLKEMNDAEAEARLIAGDHVARQLFRPDEGRGIDPDDQRAFARYAPPPRRGWREDMAARNTLRG